MALLLTLFICVPSLGCGKGSPDAPPLLSRLIAGVWRFDPEALALPPEQSVYMDTGSEAAPGFNEHGYSGGALRIRTNADDRTVIAIYVDTTRAEYASFKGLTSADKYTAYLFGDSVVVCQRAPVAESVFDTLKSRVFTKDELVAKLGAPSFNWLVHAGGPYGMTYVPQGLAFYEETSYGADDGWWLLDTTQEEAAPGKSLTYSTDYQTMCADRLSAHAKHFAEHVIAANQALTKGKPSPDGRYTAAVMNGEVYWDQILLIKEPGVAEQRTMLEYFPLDFFWIDNQTIVYGSGMSHGTFFAVNAVTGEHYEVGQVDEMVDRFGLVDSDRLWYETSKGVRGELQIRIK